MVDQIVSFLRSWLRLTRALESLLVDVVAATAPWLAPLIPAYMAWHSMVTELGFDPYIAWAGAAVVEFLGLSAVATTVQFWDWNDTKGERDSTAPVVVAVIAAVFYLAVVLLVNALLDNGSDLHKLAKGLLSSLSAVAAVILAIRGQHARRMTKREEEREDLKKRRAAARAVALAVQVSQVSPDFAQDFTQDAPQVAGSKVAILAEVAPRPDWRRLSGAEQRSLVGVPWKTIMLRYPGLSERAAQYWQERADELREVTGGNGHSHN